MLFFSQKFGNVFSYENQCYYSSASVCNLLRFQGVENDKVLELLIPKFDASNPIHRRLAELGEECSRKVEKWLKAGGAGEVKSIGKLRGIARQMLKDELKEIDELVEQILK
jgi:hypothetical protein